VLVSARDRQSAADALRRHFLSGRLSLDEFGDRVRLVLQARDGRELRRAFAGLPPVWRDGDELRRVARTAKRALVIATVSSLWLIATLVLLVAFVVGVVTHGATTSAFVGYPAAWLVVSGLAWWASRRA
jgi:uncharacterized protein DUF1707